MNSSLSVDKPSITENFVDSPKALFIFAHGAGADKSHAFMENIALKLNRYKINVVRFNFPYMDKRLIDGKKYPPNRMPVLLPCYQGVVDQYVSMFGGELPLFIGGKSMGGRVAATLASTEKNICGVVCIGYPFHPQKKPEKLRLEPLQETIQPILILQGDRDALGNEQEISEYSMSALCELHFFEDGDHDLKPRVKSGFTHQKHIEKSIQHIVKFINEKS
jgi:predicted alpha/beta-hydrolase family hydrolase